MQREIKFRVWDSDTGYFLSDYKNHLDYIQSQLKLTDYGSNAKFGFINDNLIIQQYTGINDTNNVEIYEGDIVDYSGSLMYVIEWDDLYMKFIASTITKQDGMYELTTGQLKQSNIIGNIFENPELLNQ